LVRDAMCRAQDETGQAKLFSMNITADDHYEMLARADYALETFGRMQTKLLSWLTVSLAAQAWLRQLVVNTQTSTCTTTALVTA